ncbi:hypothetical protein ACCO45_004960 [Purpureocillium lilacinum]|uniref:Uncharacterized protein n=1 Tax=Purpureocillium lilacinum TaxID=33203 RepID=A0ACC4DX46_PURLI
MADGSRVEQEARGQRGSDTGRTAGGSIALSLQAAYLSSLGIASIIIVAAVDGDETKNSRLAKAGVAILGVARGQEPEQRPGEGSLPQGGHGAPFRVETSAAAPRTVDPGFNSRPRVVGGHRWQIKPLGGPEASAPSRVSWRPIVGIVAVRTGASCKSQCREAGSKCALATGPRAARRRPDSHAASTVPARQRGVGICDTETGHGIWTEHVQIDEQDIDDGTDAGRTKLSSGSMDAAQWRVDGRSNPGAFHRNRPPSRPKRTSEVGRSERVDLHYNLPNGAHALVSPEKSPVLAAFEERCRKAKQQPFLDETLMDEREIACSWSDFKRPLLRRYNLQGSLIFIDVVGYGVDGIVWRVEVDCRIMALKVLPQRPDASRSCIRPSRLHGAPPELPILAQLRSAKTYPEQTAALQALKNEIVGHIQKKEAWIGFGVLEPIVLTLSASRSPAKPNGKDARTQLVSRPLRTGFPRPVHAAGVVPAILANTCPLSNPPQLVVAALRALTDIADAAALAQPSSPLDTSSLADNVFSPQNMEALNVMLSISSPKHMLQSQVNLASGLISRLCREEKHQHALHHSGGLGLARHAASKIRRARRSCGPRCRRACLRRRPLRSVSRAGQRKRQDRAHSRSNRRHTRGLQISLQSSRILPPPLMAVFPSVKFETAESYGPQQAAALTAMDYILPSMPVTGTRNQSGPQSSFPTPDRSDSRTSSRASLSRFSSAAVWDSPRNQSSGNGSDTATEDIESPLIPWLIHLSRTLAEPALGRKATRETSIGFLVVPILVGMVERNDKDGAELEAPVNVTQQLILETAPAVLARLITDSEFLQKAAYDCDAVKVLTKLLRRAYQPVPEIDQPKYWSPQSDTGMDDESTPAMAQLGAKGQNPLLAHRMKLREASLRAIGALAAGKEDYRKAFVAEDFVPYVVESLCEFPRKPKQVKERSKDKQGADAGRKGPSPAYGSNPVSVIIAACHVVRMLARSVSVLRTALVDYGVALPIFQFMTHRDVNVQIAATATVINLVVEVSPVRELLTESGVMKVLCEHAHSDNPALRLNALWALKHLVDAVGPELKKACLQQLEPGWLVQLICDDTQDTAVYNSRLKEAAGDDFDEDMDMQPLDEPLRWLYGSNGSIRELDASRSTKLRQAEDKLSAIREAELNPMRRARNDDIAIQEQELGQDRLFEILASKLRSRMLHPFSRRTSTSGREQRVLHPQAKIIVAVIYILVHMAASIPRHRQLVIAQTELLKLLAQQASSKDREVRVALCHLVINLTWQEDDAEAQQCAARAAELKRLGFHSKMESLKLQDRDLDVRERAKTAAWQIEQATY